MAAQGSNEQKEKPMQNGSAEQKEKPTQKIDIQSQLDSLDFEFLRSDKKGFVKETKAMYAKQCPGLSDDQEQRDLWKTLAVGRKNNIPLLPLIVDSFSRDRLDYYLKKRGSLQLQSWSVNYPTLKALSKDKPKQQMMKAAAQTFFHRYSAMIQLPTQEKYMDSIEGFCDYIAETTSFITSLLDGDMINPPFQIELMIIPNKVKDMTEEDDDDDDDDDDDEFDDDDDDDDDTDDDEDEDEKEYDPYKDIKDIKTKLDELKKDGVDIEYEYQYLPEGFKPRIFHETFKTLRHKMEEKAKNGDKNGKKNGQINNFAMPHGNRICIVVDRRKGGKSKNELFVYKPPTSKDKEGFADIPNDNLPEWYFQSSFSNIIPGKQQNDTISAKTSAKGYVFCLSFQVQQRDSIKCYLYTRSQMVRFLPTDISSLLPEFFVMKEGDENHKFVQDEKKSGSKAKTIRLQDVVFDDFRKQTKGGKK